MSCHPQVFLSDDTLQELLKYNYLIHGLNFGTNMDYTLSM